MPNYHQIQKGTAALIESGKPYFTIFNPESSKPSTLAFPTEESAWEMAEFMAAREPGSKFYVLRAGGFASTGAAPVLRTPLEERRYNGGRKPIKHRFNVGDYVSGLTIGGVPIMGKVESVDRGDESFTYKVNGRWLVNRGLRGA